MAGADIGIEVACALPERQVLLALRVPAGTTLLQAVARSRVLEQFPVVARDALRYGVFGKLEKKPGERVLQEGDRVEVYRPLLIDPMEARRARAARARAARQQKS